MAGTVKQARYSEGELQKFKELIEEKIGEANKQIGLFKGLDVNENSGDEFGRNHDPYGEAGENASKEMNATLAANQEKFIRDLKNALIRIENKTYGVCRITGKLINPNRLKLVPHATLSIEAKNARE